MPDASKTYIVNDQPTDKDALDFTLSKLEINSANKAQDIIAFNTTFYSQK